MLDVLSSPELDSQIRELDGFTALTVDFDELGFMSSSGLRVVISAFQKSQEVGAAFSVINVAPQVMRAFELTGMDKRFTVKAKDEGKVS